MWVRLLRSRGRHKVGRTIRVTEQLGRQLIQDNLAMEYTGKFPVDKMKTDFFKPKN